MNTFKSFNDLNIPTTLAVALENMKFINPTPVQASAIPVALDGKDILGTAQTGTGKTGAFGIPLLARLHANESQDALILAPSRELAAQIHEVLKQMSQGMNIRGCLVVGGESFHRQASELRRGADYIVATPGRLNDHLQEGTLKLSRIGFLVLDEVDRMLDMGFAPQIKQIMKHVPKERQTLLFSATLPKEIIGLANTFLKDPVRVAIGAISQTASEVTETTIRTSDAGKRALVLTEVGERAGKVLIFARTKSRSESLAKFFYNQGHDVVCLHGGRSQGQRKQALERFRSGTHRIMVATDLAGRGIDVSDIEHVINYDLPLTREDYVHRIGRTGRSGKKGQALNLLVTGDYEGERMLFGAKAGARPAVRSRRFAGSRR